VQWPGNTNDLIGVVYHASSTCACADPLIGVYHWLDRAPKGRKRMGVWWRPRVEYVTP